MCLLLLSSACRPSRLSLFLTFSPSQWVGWEWARSWKGIQPGKLTWTDQRDVPYHITSCSVVKIVGRVFWRKQPLLRDWMGIRRSWLISFASLVLFFTLSLSWNCCSHEGFLALFFLFSPILPVGGMGVHPDTTKKDVASKGRDSELLHWSSHSDKPLRGRSKYVSCYFWCWTDGVFLFVCLVVVWLFYFLNCNSNNCFQEWTFSFLFCLFHNGIPCCLDFFPCLILLSAILECLLVHPCRMWGDALHQHKLRKPLFYKTED